jgi:hypothetical protein
MLQTPFTRRTRTRDLLLKTIGVFLALSIVLVPFNASATSQAQPSAALQAEKAIFFVSDGMRQDLVENYAAQGLLPTFGGMLKNGARLRTAVY